MVELSEYRPEWQHLYELEAAAVWPLLREYATAIQHIGSTAVPGLLAKPIVDILVGARTAEPPAQVEAGLRAHGYTLLGQDGRRPGRWIFEKRGEPQGYNLSLVPANGLLWRENLLFRDYLRSSPSARTRYAAAKRAALFNSLASPQRYQDHKRTVVEELKAEARLWAASNADTTAPSTRDHAAERHAEGE